MNWFQRLFKKPAASFQPSRPQPAPSAIKATRESLRARYAPLYRPAVHLGPGASLGFSRLGGLPLLPAHLEWPQWKGKPQSFLAQLDLREIAGALPSFLPASGVLYFFYDQDQSAWGSGPEDLGAWRVYYCDDDPTTLAERAAPAGLAPEFIYRRKPVFPQRIEVLPDSQALPRTEFQWARDGDAYTELRAETLTEGQRHQMLGYPSPVQNDNMEEECQLAFNGIKISSRETHKDPQVVTLKAGASEWKLLLQLDTDDDTGWMWGDVGTLYFWVRESDARRGDFSKVWMIFQCC